MTISSKTRKILWAKSGNRCSICKVELFTKKEDTNEFNIGEECHIVSSKPNGPRNKANVDDYDKYDNLVLLCRNHHKEIDELTETYTEELLRYIKLNHENWVKKTLNEALNNDEKPKPKFLTRITSGKELFNIISDSHGFRTDFDEVKNEEEAEYIGGILQDFIDYGDLCGMVETYDKVKISYELSEHLKDLERKGYYLFGEKGIEKMKFGNGEVDNWTIATLLIKNIDSEDILKFETKKKNKARA